MVKSIETKYSFNEVPFSNVEFPAIVEVSEDDKLFCDNPDTAYKMFKLFIKRSYNFK